MIRISLGAFAALAFAAMVGAIALLTPPGVVEAQAHSASRAFQRTWAAPGSELRVTITARNYGAFGQVEETLPDGFTFVRSSLPGNQVAEEGQVVRFSLFGDSSFTYFVTVPTAEGQYTFTGVVKNADRDERTISGHRQLRVGRRRRRRRHRPPHRSQRLPPRRSPRQHQPLSQRPRRSQRRHPHRRPRPRLRRTATSTATPDTRATLNAHGHAEARAHRSAVADGYRPCDDYGNAGSGRRAAWLPVGHPRHHSPGCHPCRLLLCPYQALAGHPASAQVCPGRSTRRLGQVAVHDSKDENSGFGMLLMTVEPSGGWPWRLSGIPCSTGHPRPRQEAATHRREALQRVLGQGIEALIPSGIRLQPRPPGSAGGLRPPMLRRGCPLYRAPPSR